jgi:hypothetical protein
MSETDEKGRIACVQAADGDFQQASEEDERFGWPANCDI